LNVSACATVTASAAIAAAAEYRWIASDLIKQPPTVDNGKNRAMVEDRI
jgi:hypothetical protein